MKQLPLILLLFLLLSGCNEGEAVFTVQSKNYGPNAVIEIYDPVTNTILAADNLENTRHQFSLNLSIAQHALLRLRDSTGTFSFLIYLGKGSYQVNADRKSDKTYPVTASSTKETAQLIDYYNIKDQTSKSITDSLAIVTKQFDEATTKNILQKSEVLSLWSAKKITVELEAIKVFAKRYPDSQNIPFILDQLGLVETHALTYNEIFKGLSRQVQQSKAGEKLFKEITVASQMMEGSTIPVIAGENPDGQPFEASRVLKKINVIICWTTYDTKSRQASPVLVALYQKYRSQNVEFIGISFDDHKNWWTDVIRDDHLNWPQYSDLKGAKSPNAKAFSNLHIPYFLITDQKGKILTADVELQSLDFNLSNRLKPGSEK
jgi:peroxiredoxin